MAQGGVTNRATTFGLAAPGANTDILSADLTPQMAGFFVVSVSLTTSSVFNVTETQGATTYTNGLNKSNALNAGDKYVFTFPVNAATAYNFQIETDGVVRELTVMECSDFGTAQSAQGT